MILSRLLLSLFLLTLAQVSYAVTLVTYPLTTDKLATGVSYPAANSTLTDANLTLVTP
jgi:hypothetical protein